MKFFIIGIAAVIYLTNSIFAKNYEEYLPSINGMQGLSINCNSSQQFESIRRFEDLPGYDFLRTSHDGSAEVLVTAEQSESFKKFLNENKINYNVVIDDLKPIIESQFNDKKNRTPRASERPLAFMQSHFPDYEWEIVPYLKYVAQKHPDKVQLFTIGKSFEGRNMYGVKISNRNDNRRRFRFTSKPAVVIDAGIHAREWIAPTTAIYAIAQLVQNNEENEELLSEVDFYILPLVNPDGYQYSKKGPGTRMWRKTRSVIPGSKCKGVDANRNFGYQWNTVGASDQVCSEIYAGPEPFSEPETQNVRDFMLKLGNRIKVYLTLHSYGQYLLHPWGFTESLPQNERTLKCAAKEAEQALSKIRGTHYEIGSSTNVLYPAAGGSDDWAMAVAGAELSYTVELPGKGFNGFIPSPNEIIPVGRETWEAIKVFGKFAAGEICYQF